MQSLTLPLPNLFLVSTDINAMLGFPTAYLQVQGTFIFASEPKYKPTAKRDEYSTFSREDLLLSRKS